MVTPKSVIAICKKMMAPLARNIQLVVGRCVLQAIDDSKGVQVAKVSLLEGEVKEMERFQQYGFTSVPKAGAEGIAVFVGGNREHGIVLSIDNRKVRLKGLDDGHVAIYDESGTKIQLKNDGALDIETSSGGKISIDDAGDVAVEGVAKAIGLYAYYFDENFQSYANYDKNFRSKTCQNV